MIKRCDKILEDYEDKLKLVEKFVNARDKVALIKDRVELLKKSNSDERLESLITDIDKKAVELLEEF